MLKRVSPDWYAIPVPPGGRLIAQADYIHANGDVDFRVWDACSGTVLDEIAGDLSGDSFISVNTSEGSTLLLEAFLASDTRAEYALSIHVLPACAEDLDGDGEVGGGDIGFLLLSFGPCPGCVEDLDGDGEVGGSDLSLLLLSFGPCP